MCIGDDAVEVEFCVSEADSRRTHVLESVEFVPTNGGANTIDFGLVGPYCADEIGIGHFASGRNLGRHDEEESVVSFDSCVSGAVF